MFERQPSANNENPWANIADKVDAAKRSESPDAITADFNAPDERSETSETSGEDVDLRLIEQNLLAYLKREGLDENREVLKRSPETTPFHALRTHNKESLEYPAQKATYLYVGLAAGGNEGSFGALANKLYEDGHDVYIIDREGDFSGEHALNGVLDNLDQKDAEGNDKSYESVNILSISIACSEMGKAMEKHSDVLEARDENFGLTYYDPYDKQYFSLGDAPASSIRAKLSRPILGALCALTRVASLPFRRKILDAKNRGEEEGEHARKEPMSVQWIAEQFYRLGRNTIFKKDGTPYAAKYLENGGLINTRADAFLDSAAIENALSGADANIPLAAHSGPHGVVDHEQIAEQLAENPEQDQPSDGLLPYEAIRQLNHQNRGRQA
ncbi:hypothetical protein IKF15_01835 [Candidatus Saccharibacteria bacterium]|nr:hypothetical protein [Candidatus Saccharibacteria bacterium]